MKFSKNTQVFRQIKKQIGWNYIWSGSQERVWKLLRNNLFNLIDIQVLMRINHNLPKNT